MAVLAIPVINEPGLFEKCIASIDFPVELLVIDNSPEGFAAEIVERTCRGDYFVTEPPANLGFAASVNLVIKTHPADPYWLIANADVEFGKGDLEHLCAEMDKGGPRWVGITDWRVFGLSSDAVDMAGLFDEQYYPVYCEDADYEYRCKLVGVPHYFIEGTTSHVGSVSYRSDQRYARHNSRTYPANIEYYLRKWGGHPRGGETFSTPGNQGGNVADWRLDRARLAANRWT